MDTAEKKVEVQPRWTTEVYYKGFRILLTLPFENSKEAVGLMNELEGLGFTSAPNLEPKVLPSPNTERRLPPSAETKEASTEKENEIPICAVHNKLMVQRQGQYGTFWACPVKEGGVWCKYRPPKK